LENKPIDIRERTFRFGLEIVKPIEKVPHTRSGKLQISLFVLLLPLALMHKKLSAISKADFTYKTIIALCEAREIHYWLKLLKEAELVATRE
jgi:hypothetical protein